MCKDALLTGHYLLSVRANGSKNFSSFIDLYLLRLLLVTKKRVIQSVTSVNSHLMRTALVLTDYLYLQHLANQKLARVLTRPKL